MHVGIEYTSHRLRLCLFHLVVLVVPQPISICVLNQLTRHSVWFNSRSFASLPGETTSIFNHFKLPCWSKKLKVSSWVINLIQKMHTELSRKNISTEKFLCIVQSTHSTQHVKYSACFLGHFCRPWQNVRRQTTGQLEASHQQRKSNRKYAEKFLFYGLWDTAWQHLDVIQAETLFTVLFLFFVVHNIALSAADHARHLAHFWGNCDGGPKYTLHSKSNYTT